MECFSIHQINLSKKGGGGIETDRREFPVYVREKMRGKYQ